MQETRRIQLGTKVYEESVSSTPTTQNKVTAQPSSQSTLSNASNNQQSNSKNVPAILLHNDKPVLVNLRTGFSNNKCVTVAASQMVPLEKSSRISMIAGTVRVGAGNGTVTKRIGLTSVGNGSSSISSGGVINIGSVNNRTLTTGSGTGSLAFPALKVIKSPLETNKSSPIDLLSTPITDFSSIRNNGNGSRSMLFQVVKPGTITSSSGVSNSTVSLTPASSPNGLKTPGGPSPNIKTLTATPISKINDSTNNVFVATSSPSTQTTAAISPVSVSSNASEEPCKKAVPSPNSSANSTPVKSTSRGSKKHPDNHVKRPMNRFMVWSQIQRKKMFQNKPEVHNAQISKLLGEMWRALSDEEREPFAEIAKELEKQHAEKYPDYKYRPRKKQSNGQKKDNNASGGNSSTTPTKSGTAAPKRPAKNNVTSVSNVAQTQNSSQMKAVPRFNIGNSPFSNITVVNNGTSLNGSAADQIMINSPPSCSDGSILSNSDVEIQDLLETVGQKNYSINANNTPFLMDCSNGTNMNMSYDNQYAGNDRASGLLTPVSSMSDNANQDSNIDMELSLMDFVSGDMMPRDLDLFDFSSNKKEATKFSDVQAAGTNIGNGSTSLTSTLHNPMILLSDLAEGDDDHGYFSPLFESPTPSTGSLLDNDDSLSGWLADSPSDDWLQNDSFNTWMDTMTASSGPMSSQDYTYSSFDFP